MATAAGARKRSLPPRSPSPTEDPYAALRPLLTRLGLEVVPCYGDGNCLFHALAYHLAPRFPGDAGDSGTAFRTEEGNAQLRAAARTTLALHAEPDWRRCQEFTKGLTDEQACEVWDRVLSVTAGTDAADVYGGGPAIRGVAVWDRGLDAALLFAHRPDEVHVFFGDHAYVHRGVAGDGGGARPRQLHDVWTVQQLEDYRASGIYPHTGRAKPPELAGRRLICLVHNDASGGKAHFDALVWRVGEEPSAPLGDSGGEQPAAACNAVAVGAPPAAASSDDNVLPTRVAESPLTAAGLSTAGAASAATPQQLSACAAEASGACSPLLLHSRSGGATHSDATASPPAGYCAARTRARARGEPPRPSLRAAQEARMADRVVLNQAYAVACTSVSDLLTAPKTQTKRVVTAMSLLLRESGHSELSTAQRDAIKMRLVRLRAASKAGGDEDA